MRIERKQTMKVHELIRVLMTLPQDYEVVVDESSDYTEINPVRKAIKGHWAHGFGSDFVPTDEIPEKYHGWENVHEDAVLLRG